MQINEYRSVFKRKRVMRSASHLPPATRHSVVQVYICIFNLNKFLTLFITIQTNLGQRFIVKKYIYEGEIFWIYVLLANLKFKK